MEGSGFCLGDVHERVQHGEELIRLLDAFGQRVARGIDVVAGLKGQLRRAADAGDRGPKIVRHRVERFAHAPDERFDPVEHAVEEPAELVELVARPSRGDAGTERSALDRPDRGDHPSDGAQRAMGQESPADRPEQQHGDGGQRGGGPEVGEHLPPVLRGLAHL